MKKQYQAPFIEIETVEIESLLTTTSMVLNGEEEVNDSGDILGRDVDDFFEE